MSHGKPPAFQFYADDFLAGVMTMNAVERGVYITLLCLQWSRGPLSDDVDRLAHACGSDAGIVETVLNLKFKETSDGWCNQRLENVRLEQAEFRELQAERGRLGAAKRWHSDPIAAGYGEKWPFVFVSFSFSKKDRFRNRP